MAEVFLPRIKELDGLRAIAILGVISCHFAQYTHAFDFLLLGWAGVDLFSAISGFFITGILIDLRDKENPYRTFYWRRCRSTFLRNQNSEQHEHLVNEWQSSQIRRCWR